MDSIDTSEVPTFSMAERDRRWELARAFMEREDLDALLVFGEHEDAGPAPFAYDTWFTNGRAGTTVVFPRDGEPISLFPMEMFTKDHLESTRRGDPVWIPPERIRASRDARAVIAELHRLGLDRAAIGVVGLEPYPPWHPEGVVPYRLWSAVLREFPGARFEPVGMALSRLMMPLGTEEIAVVRRSAAIGDAMAHAMAAAAAPGVSESVVYAAGMAAGYAHGTTPAAMHFWSGRDPLASGLPQWSYRPQGPRTLRNGDIVSAEVFSNVGGRHTQHQVTIAVGEPHEDLLRAADVARAAYDACLRALHAGRTFGDVVRDLREPYHEAGGWEFGPSLHALNPMIAASGFPADASRRLAGAGAYPPEDDHPTMAADLELRPGMTFALEPNYVVGRHLAYLGGTVIVGENGPIELNPSTARILPAGAPQGGGQHPGRPGS
ncbi:aminopeptidase P family protein [Amycolatopsis jiangsuensis]|uniref:Xaa-Pro aminopeptidase n=1 Tax=Amycolatopsis jiangsuensis TaxID=1181879 RepID=A0A840ITF8_9PSEU|nr:aminopeptidase P family protein [Amycolatopsis jiangsuensis]MBB4684264.1 Xaa-Pro aminopeptidase [Amycolatopsis jiangsuensis]